ncbi:MAG: flagella basal body P-ring formation protein FlgA [Peptococcaceae bacterium]|jgi:pilus assembly protein CpaB|nr:flagella basal body P-ring formation protein FlgA [Peptococcaceae bacterium]
MKLNNRFIFGIVSIALAAVVAFVAIPAVSRQTNGKTEIVRVVQPVRKGAVLTTKDIEIVEVGGYNLPPNIARNENDVVGKYVTADLDAGDYILSSKVSFAPVSSDIQLSSIPSGKVAISLTVKSLASGLSDKLQTGDIVRVYHYLDGANEIPELRFVQVLSVTDSKGVNVDYSRELSEDEEKRQSATVTVLAAPEQAKIITALENDGVAHVALICRDNEKLANELLETQDAILREIYDPADEEADDEEDEAEADESAVTENPADTTSVPDGDDPEDDENESDSGGEE